MDNIRNIIAQKYPRLYLDDGFMAACLNGIVQADFSEFGDISDELALQVRITAMVCVQAICEANKGSWPPSCLHIAAHYGYPDLVQMLIKIFENCRDLTFDGSTPGQFAAARGNLRALTVLYRSDYSSLFWGIGGFNPCELLKCFLHSKEAKARTRYAYFSRIYACGDNDIPSLGVMPGKHVLPVPLRFFGDRRCYGKEVSQVSFGKYHTIFVIGGSAFSCGLGRYYKLGHGDENDQLELREINIIEPVVCVSAGTTHSVICTRKKIIVCGRNEYGQLGMGNKKLVLMPTVARFFREDSPAYIINCLAADTHTVIVMNNFDFFVSGISSGCVWQKYSNNKFMHLRNNFLHRTTSMSITEASIIRVITSDESSRIIITVDGANYYITTSTHIERCVGIFYTPKFGAIFSRYKYSFREFREEKTSGLFLFDSEHPHLLRPIYFFSALINRNVFDLVSADVTQNGQIVIVDQMGDVYEGNMEQYTLFRDRELGFDAFVDQRKDNYMVEIKVSRICGLLPAKSAFLTPDGKSKVLNLMEINPQTLLHCTKDFPRIKYPKSDMAIIVCINESSEEVGRYKIPLAVIKHESDVCASYFERWVADGKNEIRIMVKPSVLEMFLLFCRTRCLRSNLDMKELMEALIFANQMFCNDFFSAVKYELLRPPLEMSHLRDLFALARYLSSVELYDCLSELCAAMFPTLLESGFINQLSMDEITRIENAFRPYTSANIVAVVDELDTAVRHLVVPKKIVTNIISDVLAVVRVPMDTDEFVDYCKRLSSQFYRKKRRKHMRPAKRRMNKKEWPERQRNIEEEDGNQSSNMLNDHNIVTPENSDTREESHLPEDTQVADSTEEEVCEKSIKSEENVEKATSSAGSSKVVSDSISISNKAQVSNIPSAGTSKRTWNIPKADPPVSLSVVLAEEEKKANMKKQIKKNPCYMSSHKRSVGTDEPQKSTSRPWRLDEPVASGSSLAQIMEAEEARQLETMRQTSSRLKDIEDEEQAMSELIAHYKSEAALRGVSVTISAERKMEERNDPIWPARS